MPFNEITLFPASIKSLIWSVSNNSHLTIYLKRFLTKEIAIKKILKDCFSDVTTIDMLTNQARYILAYQFFNIINNHRQNLLIDIPSFFMGHPSISNLFIAALFAEREVYDMFGIFFNEHPDLRRILTDYGFRGHPLRKDFPLSGFLQVRYSNITKNIVFEALELPQEFRYFTFQTPWVI